MSQVASSPPPAEGSKFKRFLKRFGRKPSDEAGGGASSSSANAASSSSSSAVAAGPHPAQQSSDGKRSKPRGNSFLAKNKNNANGLAPPSSSQQRQQKPALTSTESNEGNRRSMFAGVDGGQGLADTLVMPSGPHSSAAKEPAPQLAGLPSHEPFDSSALATVPSQGDHDSFAPGSRQIDTSLPSVAAADSNLLGNSDSLPTEPSTSSIDASAPAVSHSQADPGFIGAGSYLPQSESSSSPAHSRRDNSFDVDSADGIRRRDSTDNRTMDTGKSTKPTTVLSLERDQQHNQSAGMAHIAQYVQTEQQTPTTISSSPTSRGSIPASSSVQFAATTNPSGAIVNLPGYGEPSESSPYTNVPSNSRPHPSNNPTPFGIPGDNASMLTLASSTAANSIAGGAPSSSRGHQHTPSLGGARSIGGSYMGDRRNSSDTYASMKAIPPLSRRGSDDSTRTGSHSVAASATGLNSAQAMTSGSSMTNVNMGMMGGPGAPHDRLSIQRTNSQRTIATQRSIPFSIAASNSANPHGGGGGGSGTTGSTPVMLSSSDRRGSTGSTSLLAGGGGTAASNVAAAHRRGENIGPSGGSHAVTADSSFSKQRGGHTGSGSGGGDSLDVPEITETGPSPNATDVEEDGEEESFGSRRAVVQAHADRLAGE